MCTHNIEYRQAKVSDVNEIIALFRAVFGSSSEEKLLTWLLKKNDIEINGYVAAYNNNVVGFVGYILNNYSAYGKMLEGIHPVLWSVHPEYTGLGIGKELYKRVLECCNFSVIFEGTDKAKRMYPTLGYRKIGNAVILKFFFIKDFFPHNIQDLIKISSLFLNKLTEFVLSRVLRGCRMDVERCDGNVPVEFPEFLKSDVQKVCNLPSTNKILWLQEYPFAEKFFLRVYKDKEQIGWVFLYRSNQEKKYGRIIYQSPMELSTWEWIFLMIKIKDFASGLGIETVSALSTNKKNIFAMLCLGFVPIAFRPIWANKFIDKGFDLSFLEGDAFYRGI